MEYTITLTFTSDNVDTVTDLGDAIATIAPYMVDNVSLHVDPEPNTMDIPAPKRHDKRTCEHCHNGYRTDFIAIDHYGHNTKATRDCDAGIKACKSHQCYWMARKVGS